MTISDERIKEALRAALTANYDGTERVRALITEAENAAWDAALERASVRYKSKLVYALPLACGAYVEPAEWADHIRSLGRDPRSRLEGAVADAKPVIWGEAQANERAANLSALRILIEGKPGAAQNAVREDYPDFAEIVDGEIAAVVQAFAERVAEHHCLRRYAHYSGATFECDCGLKFTFADNLDKSIYKQWADHCRQLAADWKEGS